MTTTQIIASIWLLVPLVGIVWLWCGPIQRYFSDASRQRLFELRDQLFDLAAKGKLDFASADYRQLREHCNALIARANHISWPYLLWMALCTKLFRVTLRRVTPLREHAEAIQDEATRKQVEHIVFQVYLEVGLLLIRRSFVLLAVLCIPLAVVVLLFLYQTGKNWLTKLGRLGRGFGEKIARQTLACPST